MSDSHFSGRIVQKALIVKGGKVLITRDSRDKVFELPGGRLDKDEEPMAGMLREIKEELGVEAKVNRILNINKVYHGRDNEDMIAVYYVLSLADKEPKFNVDPIEVEEMQWVDEVSYKTYKFFPEYKEALKHYFNTTP